jgi:hypothetical protein
MTIPAATYVKIRCGLLFVNTTPKSKIEEENVPPVCYTFF